MTKKTTAARETLDAAKGKAVKKQQTADALGAENPLVSKAKSNLLFCSMLHHAVVAGDVRRAARILDGKPVPQDIDIHVYSTVTTGTDAELRQLPSAGTVLQGARQMVYRHARETLMQLYKVHPETLSKPS